MTEKEKEFRKELATAFHNIEQILRRYDPTITDIEAKYDREHRSINIKSIKKKE